MRVPVFIRPRSAASPPTLESPWAGLVPRDQWDVFVTGADALEQAGVSFVLGGAMAMAAYTRHWRTTKDVDVIVKPLDHEKAVAALQAAGFSDYFAQEAYDRTWIFRGYRDGVIFDIFWELPNHRVKIDEGWFERAPTLLLRDRRYGVAPAEELVRVKLYVMQRERCDWVDVLNILAGAAEELDWGWLVQRMGRDLPLLQAVLSIFNWLCPGRAENLPDWVRKQFALPKPVTEDPRTIEERRARLFDSRPWFASHQPLDQPLER